MKPGLIFTLSFLLLGVCLVRSDDDVATVDPIAQLLLQSNGNVGLPLSPFPLSSECLINNPFDPLCWLEELDKIRDNKKKSKPKKWQRRLTRKGQNKRNLIDIVTGYGSDVSSARIPPCWFNPSKCPLQQQQTDLLPSLGIGGSNQLLAALIEALNLNNGFDMNGPRIG